MMVIFGKEADMDIVWQAEDSLCEKKVESDLKDLLKTLVAFANSVAWRAKFISQSQMSGSVLVGTTVIKFCRYMSIPR